MAGNASATLKNAGRMQFRKVALALGFPDTDCFSASDEQLISHILEVGKDPTPEQITAIKVAAKDKYSIFAEALGLNETPVAEDKVKGKRGRKPTVAAGAVEATSGEAAGPGFEALAARIDALGAVIDKFSTEALDSIGRIDKRVTLLQRGMIATLCVIDSPRDTLTDLPEFDCSLGGEDVEGEE